MPLYLAVSPRTGAVVVCVNNIGRQSGGTNMRVSRITAVIVAVWIGVLGSATAQVGHPVKGSWVGYWGQGAKDQRRLILNMDWQDNKIVGVINPGPKAVQLKRVDIDYENWTLVLEADMPNAAGVPARWVATGKLENLGSWNSRRYSGTYKHGAETGKFEVILH